MNVLYGSLVRALCARGAVLARGQYRFLHTSDLAFSAGLVAAATVGLIQTLAGAA